MFLVSRGLTAKTETATHPIAPLARALAVLPLLAGDGPATSSRLASERARSTLGRVQLRFPD